MLYIDFSRDKRITKKYGKCIMYLGFIMVFITFLGLVVNILNLFFGIRPDDYIPKNKMEREEFGEFNIVMINILKIS